MIESFLMIGCPGAGKSTLAAAKAKEIDGIVLSVDAIRLQLYGSEEISGRFYEIVNVMEEVIEANQDRPFIIDGTHYSTKYRNNARFLLEKIGHLVSVIVVHPSLEICLKQNQQRDRHVPEDAIRECYEEIAKSLKVLPREGFTRIIMSDTQSPQ